MGRHTRKIEAGSPEALHGAALGDLLREKGFTASPEPERAPAPAADGIDLAKVEKIVLRRERKGRGGKTVTMVSNITLPATQLEVIARAMRKALGCGATLEGDAIVLQGDLVSRAQAWLQAHGARRIVVSGG